MTPTPGPMPARSAHDEETQISHHLPYLEMPNNAPCTFYPYPLRLNFRRVIPSEPDGDLSPAQDRTAVAWSESIGLVCLRT